MTLRITGWQTGWPFLPKNAAKKFVEKKIFRKAGKKPENFYGMRQKSIGKTTNLWYSI